ncbi:putative actin patch assembly and actin polymerization protein [Orbilia brochopaga]|uniref:Actin patch assembly and actin polymerization protein n=1 Tax=Orbilia brochopaga TaxID=3140254 RepID=A0AAV9UT49_9PEZI
MFASKKPYSAVSVQVEQLTTEAYEENDLSGIPELIEAIRLQDTGPQEAARAIRKKLKYGNIHRQIRALTILDALVENAGKRFQRSFADEPLLERLRILASDSLTDPDVRKKAQILFAQWHGAYKDAPGMSGIANLHRSVPTRPRPRPQPRPVSPEDDDVSSPPPRSGPTSPGSSSHHSHAGPSHSRNSSSSKPQAPITLGPSDAPIATFKPPKDKSSKKSGSSSQQKRPPFNLEKEKPTMIQNIATASIASTNLKNALKLINREKERVSENPEVMKRFEACKLLRRQILRYIQFVESEQWLGGLIHANEELVEALTLFEVLDKPPGEDSDSEGEWEQMPKNRAGVTDAAGRLGKLKIGGGGDHGPMQPGQVPPRQRDYDSDELEDASDDEEPEDPNDPFGDSHALKTPAAEKGELRWAVV